MICDAVTGILIRSMPESDSQPLLGEWRQVRPNPHPASIVITFEEGGRLRYTIEDATVQPILLTWRVEDDTLFTGQPDTPGEEAARFWFATADRLVLERDGELYQYERV